MLPLFVANRIFLDFADYPDGPNGGELLAARNRRRAGERRVGAFCRFVLFEEDGLPWWVSATRLRAAEGLTRLGHLDKAQATAAGERDPETFRDL